MRWYVAVQFEWQSSSAPMMPPFSTPSNASYCGSGIHSATTVEGRPATESSDVEAVRVGRTAAEALAERRVAFLEADVGKLGHRSILSGDGGLILDVPLPVLAASTVAVEVRTTSVSQRLSTVPGSK